MTTWDMGWADKRNDDGSWNCVLHCDWQVVAEGTYSQCYAHMLTHGSDADTYREAGLYSATVAALRARRAEQVAKLAARDAAVQP